MENIQPAAAKLNVTQADELAKFYNMPQSLVNMFFIVIGDNLTPKEPFLALVAHKKGIQRVAITEPLKDSNGEWKCKCSVYPKIPPEVIHVLPTLTPAERKQLLDYYMAPTEEWGRASPENVKASTMQKWLPEMSIKRAVARAYRRFSGVSFTAYEELPDAELTPDQISEAQELRKTAERPATVAQPAQDVNVCRKCNIIKSAHPTTPDKMLMADAFCAYNPDQDKADTVEYYLTQMQVDTEYFKRHWKKSDGEKTTVGR